VVTSAWLNSSVADAASGVIASPPSASKQAAAVANSFLPMVSGLLGMKHHNRVRFCVHHVLLCGGGAGVSSASGSGIRLVPTEEPVGAGGSIILILRAPPFGEQRVGERFSCQAWAISLVPSYQLSAGAATTSTGAYDQWVPSL